ncbi:MAG: shikimate dehydrogenase [Actinomycetota bacterium]
MSRGSAGGATRTFGVIGWPVVHSLSPAIHNAAIEALGIDAIYVPLPVRPGSLPEALAGLEGLGFSGANVTMPHKTEAAGLMAVTSEDAARLQAVNTIVVADGGLAGHNTDAPGFERMLRHDEGFDAAGASVLLIGAGGAARACALALARARAARIAVAVRDTASAGALLHALEGLDTTVDVLTLGDAPGVRADLIVNATPLGAQGEEVPTPPLEPGMLVIDLLYEPSVTPLVTRARAAGASAAAGLGLLLHQAALSFELWTGQVPPIDVMSAAALAAIADRA